LLFYYGLADDKLIVQRRRCYPRLGHAWQTRRGKRRSRKPANVSWRRLADWQSYKRSESSRLCVFSYHYLFLYAEHHILACVPRQRQKGWMFVQSILACLASLIVLFLFSTMPTYHSTAGFYDTSEEQSRIMAAPVGQKRFVDSRTNANPMPRRRNAVNVKNARNVAKGAPATPLRTPLHG